MTRLNRRLPLKDLMLAQLDRRLQLAAQPDHEEDRRDAAIELVVGLVVLGIVSTFALLLLVLR